MVNFFKFKQETRYFKETNIQKNHVYLVENAAEM